jgi:hypothetical protein
VAQLVKSVRPVIKRSRVRSLHWSPVEALGKLLIPQSLDLCAMVQVDCDQSMKIIEKKNILKVKLAYIYIVFAIGSA